MNRFVRDMVETEKHQARIYEVLEFISNKGPNDIFIDDVKDYVEHAEWGSIEFSPVLTKKPYFLRYALQGDGLIRFQEKELHKEFQTMASLSKEITKKGTAFRIQFEDAGNQRRSIRLGVVPEKHAKLFCSRVEEIVSCQLSGLTPSRETSVWIGDLSDKIYEKLSGVGLVPPRRTTEIDAYIRTFIARHQDIKPGTRTRWNLDRKKLIGFFGTERRADTVTRQEANEYKQYLFKKKHARATISKFLSNARMFFSAMLADGLIRSNPFDGVTVTAVVNESRNVHVPSDVIDKVMETAPDVDWRIIIALSRFGGLRSPSEVLSLKWENVFWRKKRILVVSPKTAHHPNGQQREIPIFKELDGPLRNAWNSRPVDAVFVVSRHRSRGR